MIKIAIDAMGGDYAPAEQVKGAVLALEKQKDLYLYLCGDKDAVAQELAKYTYDKDRVEIVPTTEIITNDEEPAKAVKAKNKLRLKQKKLRTSPFTIDLRILKVYNRQR